MENKKKVVICWIGIGIYNTLFDTFYKSFNEKFCNDLEKTFFIFTDNINTGKNLPNCIQYLIPNACTYKEFVLFRKFKYLLLAEDKYLDFDYVVFANGNLFCKQNVFSNEFIVNDKIFTACSHPFGAMIKANNRCINEQSTASFFPTTTVKYVQASFIFAKSTEFLKLANTIEGWRHLDKATGADKYITWHDEIYYNKYYYENYDKVNVIDGKIYIMYKNTPTAKIVALNKYRYLNDYKLPNINNSDLYNLS